MSGTTATEVPRISAEEAMVRSSTACTMFIDVRKPEYYERLRIAGSISIPLKGPIDRYWELPRDCDVILY